MTSVQGKSRRYGEGRISITGDWWHRCMKRYKPIGIRRICGFPTTKKIPHHHLPPSASNKNVFNLK